MLAGVRAGYLPRTHRAAGTSSPADAEHMKRLCQHLLDLGEYLKNSWAQPEELRHAHRYGLRTLSSPAESGMSHLVNQRMDERQPMCWPSEGDHLLVQVRRAVLDGRIETLFREQHPRFRLAPLATELPAMSRAAPTVDVSK